MKAVFVKRKILGYGKSDDIRLGSNLSKNICQRVHFHCTAAAAISTKLGVCKIGGVEEMLVEHINIQMYEDMVEALDKFGDLLGADKAVTGKSGRSDGSGAVRLRGADVRGLPVCLSQSVGRRL